MCPWTKRSAEWWSALQPRLETFWADVESARRGEFIVPAATGARGRTKATAAALPVSEDTEEICQIQLPGLGI